MKPGLLLNNVEWRNKIKNSVMFFKTEGITLNFSLFRIQNFLLTVVKKSAIALKTNLQLYFRQSGLSLLLKEKLFLDF